MTEKTSAPEIRLLDNPHASDVFASEATGFFLNQGNVTITLASIRPDYSAGESHMNRVVIGRLVMPVSAAQSLVVGLYDFLKKHGLDPARKPEGESVQ